jgi:hypothetical protein
LDVATETRLVAARLNQYRREQLESGRLFEDSRFGTFDERADRLLIDDLKTVREELQAAGLHKTNLKYAHSLIGRSIFIRYLEDREILKRSYFDEVAEDNPEWQALLEVPLEQPDVNPEMEGKLYPRILSSHEFTYALFDKLAKDFNGDMFPSDPRVFCPFVCEWSALRLSFHPQSPADRRCRSPVPDRFFPTFQTRY